MNSSFYTGLSGMKAHQYGIDVLSDNIANVNTSGYKATSVDFSTIYSQQMTGSLFDPTTNDIGVGSVGKGVRTDFSSGSIIDSENKYDMVIEGAGWFGVKDSNNDIAYTRAGQFSRDADGFLVDANGNYVLGTSANNVEGNSIKQNPSTTIELTDVENQQPIQIPDDLTIPSVASTYINFKGPLNPKKIEEVGPDGNMVEVPNVEVYRADVYDSQGNTNKLDITFTKEIPQASSSTTWNATAVLKDANGNILSTEDGQLFFNGRGALTGSTLTSIIDNNGDPLALGFGTFYDENIPNSGYDGLVSLAGLDSSRDIEKDGNPSGTLLDYGVDNLGNIQATFSNGKTVPISKVAIYHFRNEEGLSKVGTSHYKVTANSGEAKFFKDQAGNTLQISNIKNRKVEISNINITTALTDLIVLQKAYDASSKSITTSDQMIQNAINMKR
jgi:flagellar hook protein FlgE